MDAHDGIAEETLLKRSIDRILTTHPGRLPNPDNYADIMARAPRR